MATIPTQNAVPSEAPRDLKFNSGKIDEFVTSLEHEYKDRFGRSHLTVEGMRWIFEQLMERFRVDINQAIIAAGYIPMDSFQLGAEITKRNEILRDETTGEYYRWDGDLPKTVPAGSTPESDGGVGVGAWVGVGDASLRWDLSVRSGASLVGTESGSNVQIELSDLSEKTNYLYGLVDFVKISDYSDLADGDDWTNAIQAALDTGKPVYGSGTYKVSGKLKSKGQRLIGNWFINASHMPVGLKVRQKIPAISTPVEDGFPVRMIYSSVAWDLCDMLAIKSLGFTVVHSYAGFSGHESAAGGDVKTLLDNCLSAGLKVQLGTEDALNASNANMTLKEFIEAFDGHDALFGYSVFDEPATRRISVADQDKKISEMRSLTNKALTCVDLVEGVNSPFYENWSKNYDIFFVNSYAQHYEDGDFTSWVRRDEQKNRIDIGGVIAMSRCAKIIPVVGMSVSTSGQYSRDRDQMITNSLFFGRKGGGEYGCFIWDLPFENTPNAAVNVSPQFQDACFQLSKQPYTGNSPATDVYIFGGTPGYHNYGVGSIINKLIVADPAGLQKSGWSGAYPAIRVINDNTFCGIGFKDADSILPTTIDCKKYVSYYLDAFDTSGMQSGVKLRFSGALGAGYGGPISPDYDLSSKKTFIGSTMYGGDSRNKTLTISVIEGKNTADYELFIRGMIVCTDW